MDIPKILGYRRENGRVGVRNHVVILPLDDLSNAACEAVASNIKGTLALPHAYGRLQFGEDLELFFRTIIGTGSNPNVAAVVVIGIEPEWTDRIVQGIARTGKPVKGFIVIAPLAGDSPNAIWLTKAITKVEAEKTLDIVMLLLESIKFFAHLTGHNKPAN